MLAELVRFGTGWPLALSLAVAVTAQGLLAGRRRTALNEALHELRRPLQALVLAVPAAPRPGGEELSRQTAVALERLEREINGEPSEPASEAVAIAPLLAGAVARWRLAAEYAGRSLELREGAARVEVRGDRDDLARALDNLIVNAVEHGGPRVRIEAEVGDGATVRIAVADSGAGERRGGARARSRAREAGTRAAVAVARLGGRRRRGHGLRVVRRVAAAHGGELRLRRGVAGTEAVLVLPLLEAGEAR